MQELDEIKKVLDEDEEIKEYFKPNKKRYVLINIIFSLFFMLLIFGGLFVIGILGTAGVIEFTSDGEPDAFAPIMMIVMSTPALLAAVLTAVGYVARYNRSLYVVTNKRLIIRSGFIGVDYKSIELKYIGLVNVRVDFLDKLAGGNTGSITFASAAIPMNGQNNQNGTFCFSCVNNPYEVYKKVKAYIPEKE